MIPFTQAPHLSDAELCTYIQHYAHYKVKRSTPLAGATPARRLCLRGHRGRNRQVFYATRAARMRPSHLAPRHLRWLASGICILGIGLAIVLYVTAASPSPHPLGYDPFTSKKYVRELELYGGKINVLAVELHQWLASLWRGKALAYTVAVLHSCFHRSCGSSVPVRALSMRNRRKYPRPPPTHGHDRLQPSEKVSPQFLPLCTRRNW